MSGRTRVEWIVRQLSDGYAVGRVSPAELDRLREMREDGDCPDFEVREPPELNDAVVVAPPPEHQA